MEAKIKKTYVLTVGTNEQGKTEQHLEEAVVKLEQFGNDYLGVRFHVNEVTNIEEVELDIKGDEEDGEEEAIQDSADEEEASEVTQDEPVVEEPVVDDDKETTETKTI